MSTFSKEHKMYLKNKKKEKRVVILFQILILIVFLVLWEFAAHYQLINTFLSSSPTLVVKTFSSLIISNDLLSHIAITVYETILSFIIASIIILLKSLGATKKDIFFKVILPANISNIINNLKINLSMAFIGVIMGELLVSKKGLGYLIVYGTQVFNINLVICSVFLLGVLSFAFYYLICLLENKIKTRK